MPRTTALLTFTFLGLCLLTGCPDEDDVQTNKDGWDINQNDMGTMSEDMMRTDQGVMPDLLTMQDQTIEPADQGIFPDMQEMGRDVPPDMPVVNEPNIVTPTEVVFARLATGLVINQLFEIKNTGGQPLVVNEIVLSPASGSPFSLSYPDPGAPDDLSRDSATWPTSVAAGRAFSVRVTYAHVDGLPNTAQIFVDSNDPDSPQSAIRLRGDAGTPCVALAGITPLNNTFDYLLDFGASQIGAQREKTISIENCSRTEDLTISDVILGDNGNGTFAISRWSAGGPVVIAPRQTEQLKISYAPTSMIANMGALELRTSDPSRSTMNVKLEGNGDNNVCPVALAGAKVLGSTTMPSTQLATAPLTTIDLDGSMSRDADGSIARHEWTLLSKPVGSTTRLTPSNSSVKPKLFLDLSGQYELELTVYDDMGLASCQPAVVVIQATYASDLGVELVWDTPGDMDQTDTFGTDLDLHYKRSAGRWENSIDDIYWRNPSSDWGVAGDASDDPSLDIDDTDGSGPEFISHDNPDNGVYNVGAYYYNDNGFGPSYGTVRIYRNGVIMHEEIDRFLQNENIFWYIGDITVTTNTITYQNSGTLSTGFPQ